MKKLFLRFALLTGLFLVGFTSSAWAAGDDLTLNLIVKVSEYSGADAGQVALSAYNYPGSVAGGWYSIPINVLLRSDERGDSKYNQVTVHAKANTGYTFKYWADADNKTSMPEMAQFGKEISLYSNLGAYIKRSLCQNPGYEQGDGSYMAYFHYHVKGTFGKEHHDAYTLYAVFEPNEHTVTFVDGGETVATSQVKYNNVYGLNGPLPTRPAREGYRFDGWFNSSDQQVLATDIVTVDAPETLTAKWTALNYTIHFVDEEQSQSFSDAIYSAAMPELSTSYLPTVAEKYFAGFYTKPNGQGTRVYAGVADGGHLKLLSSLKVVSDTTLYAHYAHTHHNMYWDYSYYDGSSWHNITDGAVQLKYARLTFKKADGSTIKSVILEATAPTGGTSLGDGLNTHLTSLANINLHVGSASDVLNLQNVDVYFTDEQLAAFAAYTFEAISAKPSTVATNWAVTTDKLAHHTVLNYTGATGENIYQQQWSVELNGLLINPDYIYVMPLYWNGSEWRSISQLDHTYGVQCVKSSEENLADGVHKKATYMGSYPVWKKDEKSDYYRNAIGLVGFNLGGNNYFMNTTNPGVFSSSYNSATATDPFVVVHGENTAETETAVISFTVPATKIPVIHFLANDGELSATTPNYLVCAENQVVDLAAYAATREGYTFLGWAEAGGSVQSSLTANMAHTLNAQWEGEQHTVTLHKNDGTADVVDVTANYMAAMPVATVPTRTGYDFTGYWDINNVKYYTETATSARIYDKMEDCHLYAGWKAKTYTASFSLNSATGTAPVSQTATFDKPLTDVAAPAWIGHSFLGYFDDATAGTKYIDAEGHCIQAWDKTADATLYAHWEEADITLTATEDPQNRGDFYTTFYVSHTACQIMTEDVTAYIAAEANNGYLYLEEIEDNIIPAGEAVLLQATQATIQLVPVSSSLTIDGNLFEGVDEETNQENGYKYYVFGAYYEKVEDLVPHFGFVPFEWIGEDDQPVKGTLGAHKAFYRVAAGSPSAAPSRYVFRQTGVATDMQSAQTNHTPVRKMLIRDQIVIERNGVRYNVQGRVIE